MRKVYSFSHYEVCEYCGRLMTYERRTKKYCSSKCKTAAWRARQQEGTRK